MKLLFFIHSLGGGGAERVLLNLATELVKKDHNVYIAINRDNYAYKVDDRIKVISAPRKKANGKEKLISKTIRNLNNLMCFHIHTRNSIREVNPDVIISFLFCNMGSILLFHGNIPIVHSEHNSYDRSLRFGYYFKRFVLNRFYNRVYVLTPFDYGYAKAKGFKNVVVMPNPNTFEIISHKDYEHLFPFRKNLLACGRVRQWHIKGFDMAIESFSRISNKYPTVDLDIVGDYDEKSMNYLKQIASIYGVSNRIHFLGRSNDIQSVMQSHQIFIMSSRTEGFPMVVTEAMTQGLPCVCFERLASSIIMNGIDGFLTKDNNVNEMSEKISFLLENRDILHSLGEEAIKNVSRFSVDTIADRWISDFYLLMGLKTRK